MFTRADLFKISLQVAKRRERFDDLGEMMEDLTCYIDQRFEALRSLDEAQIVGTFDLVARRARQRQWTKQDHTGLHGVQPDLDAFLARVKTAQQDDVHAAGGGNRSPDRDGLHFRRAEHAGL